MWWFVVAGCVPASLPDWVKGPIPIEGDDPPCASARYETVVCTLDGDTFDVGVCGQDAGGERIRMLGIDAPEIAHDPDPADCWGDQAWAELERLLDGEEVLLSFDTTCVDPYERTLAYVWLLEDLDGDDDSGSFTEDGESGTLVNEWMLENGHARLYEEDWVDDLRLQDRLDEAAAEGESKGLGLWAACD